MLGLRSVAKTFWIGGMWVIGILVTPALFKLLDKVTAGMLAGKLFAMIAWVGVFCGLFLLIDYIWRHGVRGMKDGCFWLIIGMLLCTIINHFAITPIIGDLKSQMNQAAEGLFGGGFGTWHAISSLIYLLQSILGLIYIWRSE